MRDLLAYLPVLERLKTEQDLRTQEDAAGRSRTVNTDDAQTINAQKTFANAPVRVLDGNGTLIHAFGTKT